MNEGKKPSENKSLKGKNLILMLALLILGGALGYAAKICPQNDCLSGNPSNTQSDTALTAQDSEKETQGDDTQYKIFSEPDVYFTFEYPSTWVYEKEETAPGEEFNETLHVFYADAEKKQPALSLHYPMYETAMDTCLKFEEVTDYTHEHIATNDSGTFVNYMVCGGTEYDPAESYWAGHSMGDIFWQKGVWDGDKTITSDINTQARIHWDDNTDIVTERISSHLAHSVKIK